jgi:hypothetical protein
MLTLAIGSELVNLRCSIVPLSGIKYTEDLTTID